MAGPGGKSVGRVSIRVVPNSSRFKEDLKKTLQRIENSTVLNVPMAVDTRQAQLDLKRFQKKWNGESISFDVDAKTLGAAAHMKEFTRRRTIPISVSVSKASLAKAATLIASLSGARLLGDIGKDIGDKLMNLDRALPKLAAVALGVGAIGAAGISSVGGLFTVAAGLASIGGAGLAAPAIVGGLAVGITTLVVALKDAPKQLAALGPSIRGLQTIINDKFWAGARKPIIDLTRSVLPDLRKGFANTASELGGWAASLASGFKTALGGGVLTGLFNNLNQSITIASGGTGAFASTIVTLGTVGGTYLPKLATWISGIATQFNNFVQGAAADGRLVQWIDGGIAALGQLGSSVGSIFSIINGINTAAQAAGGGGLAVLATTLAAVAEIVNGPAFQSTLSTIFAGAAAGAEGLANAVGPIGAMFTALAPTIANVMATSGQVVGNLLGQIASALAQPAFATGLTAFFDGLQQGLLAIGPALPAVAAALGTLGSFVGALAAQLGPVLGTALGLIAPILSELLAQIQPLLPLLGDALVSALSSILPVVGTLISTLLPPLVSLIAAIIPVIQPVLDALLPLITTLLPPLMEIIQALIPALIPIIGLIAPLVQLLAAILVPTIQMLVLGIQPVLALLKILTPVIQIVATVIGALADIITTVLLAAFKAFGQLLRGDFSGAIKTMSDAFSGVGDIVKKAFSSMIGFALNGANSIIDVINGIISGVASIASGLKNLTGGAIDIKLAKIPHLNVPKLALGADILPTSGGVIARLAEAGRRERVIDAGLGNRNLELQNRLLDQATARGGAGTTHIDAPMTVIVRPEDDARLVGRQAGREFLSTIAGDI